MVEKVSR